MAKTAQEAIQNLSQRMKNPDGLSDGQIRNRRSVYPKAEVTAPKPRRQVAFDELFENEAGKVCRAYEVTPQVACIVQYFLRVQNFGDGIVSNQPDLSKGLYIHGTFGTGKSMIFAIMHEIGRRLILEHGYHGMWYTSVTAPWLVEEYMKSADRSYMGNFDLISYYRGPLYIDDLGMERLAFGRDDIIADLLFERHRNQARTYITSNLSPKNFSQKYGPRLGDRLPEAFNIIEFTGKSYRE